VRWHVLSVDTHKTEGNFTFRYMTITNKGATPDRSSDAPAQMSLSEHDQVVDAFPSDRADESLCVPVLQARSMSRSMREARDRGTSN
jgi:hypothetical protein